MQREVNCCKIDTYYMDLALQEAKKGLGRTSPNPCVGAVIVKYDKIISRGYHKKAGTPHAEINALDKAGDKAAGATMYVTLEPCNHTGQTPPCSHAVATAGIVRVVVGMQDPNPLVDGSGANYLRKQGIDVLLGVLEERCVELNKPFIKYISTGRPLVIMKAGISLDGMLSYQASTPGKITGTKSSRKLHSLRNQYDAILVGRGTVVADNPSLTSRTDKDNRDPLRVILDSSLSLPFESKILHLDSSSPTLIFYSECADKEKMSKISRLSGVTLKSVSHDHVHGLSLEEILKYLGEIGICSLLVEGGACVHSSFLKQGLIDRVMLFVAPLFAGTAGTPLLQDFPVVKKEQAPRLSNVTYEQYGEDILIEGDLFWSPSISTV